MLRQLDTSTKVWPCETCMVQHGPIYSEPCLQCCGITGMPSNMGVGCLKHASGLVQCVRMF